MIIARACLSGRQGSLPVGASIVPPIRAAEIEEKLAISAICGPAAGLIVSIADPRAMFARVDNPDVAPVA